MFRDSSEHIDNSSSLSCDMHMRSSKMLVEGLWSDREAASCSYGTNVYLVLFLTHVVDLCLCFLLHS